MPDIHLSIGGSTAARTVKCPAWISRSKDIPRSTENAAADLGTLKHHAMEAYYRDGKDFSDLVGVLSYNDIILDEDMVIDSLLPAQEAADTVFDKYQVENIYIEPFVQYIEGLAGGSIDVLGFSEDGKTCVTLDWKFGRILVDVVDNKQVLMYTLSAIKDKIIPEADLDKIERFVGVVVQPKQSFTPQVWEFGIEEVVKFQTELDAAIESSQSDTPIAKTGGHCQYCPAAPYCPEKLELIGGLIAPKIAEDRDLSTAMKLVPEIEDWCKDVRKHTHDTLNRGVKVPGFKLVEKRATRKWASESEVAALIRNAKKITLSEGFENKLRSPAQIEKICKRKDIPFDRFTPFVTKESTGTTLTTEDDKRKAIEHVSEMTDTLSDAISGKK